MQQNGGFGVAMLRKTFIGTRSSAVKLSLPPALGYIPLRYVRASSPTNWVRRCPQSCAGSALQAGFGCDAVFTTSKAAYPWPSIVLLCSLASFAEAH